MTDSDEIFMRRAIKKAEESRFIVGTSPVGAVLVQNSTVVAEAYNEVGRRNDPTAHAEMLTLREAGAATGRSRFAGSILYSTLQPCGMCTMAAIWAGVGTIIYGAERDQVHQMYFEDQHLDIMDFIRDAFRNDMVIKRGVLADICAELYFRSCDDPPLQKQANLPPTD